MLCCDVVAMRLRISWVLVCTFKGHRDRCGEQRYAEYYTLTKQILKYGGNLLLMRSTNIHITETNL